MERTPNRKEPGWSKGSRDGGEASAVAELHQAKTPTGNAATLLVMTDGS